ncbi:hypothetical protein AAG570_010520 [Ranatra chinensis]|uniref:Cyclic nucleotide-binding domain-containing protein n=1 Tax=Ranatra chinensis TaxID=642074 RepID=A0ABD0Z4W4_9HEMI
MRGGFSERVSLLRRRPPVCGESSDPYTENSPTSLHFHKSESQKRWLLGEVKKFFLFQNLDVIKLQEIIDAFGQKKAKGGETICEAGEIADRLMIVEKGLFHEYPTGSTEVKCYCNKGSFGQISLLYDIPNPTKIVAMTSGILWFIDRATYRNIVLKDEKNEDPITSDFLSYIPIFSNIGEAQKAALDEALNGATMLVKDGKCIKKNGAIIDGIYVIKKGIVTLASLLYGIKPVYLKSGDYFGINSTNNIQIKKMDAYAVGDVILSFIDCSNIKRILEQR